MDLLERVFKDAIKSIIKGYQLSDEVREIQYIDSMLSSSVADAFIECSFKGVYKTLNKNDRDRLVKKLGMTFYDAIIYIDSVSKTTDIYGTNKETLMITFETKEDNV